MKTWLSPHRLDGDMSHCHTGSLAVWPTSITSHRVAALLTCLCLLPPHHTVEKIREKVWTVPLILFQPKQLLFFPRDVTLCVKYDAIFD